ncbi:MAG: mechanosensitive ion channel family protein [Flavobacteriaceae bacterium]|nr:mechanosensitive ion channel family protein [Flavobacteriaceae bacterium]
MMQNIKQFFSEQFYYLYDMLPQLIIGVLVVLVFWFIGSKVKNISQRKLQKRMDDPLLATFIARIIKAVFIVIGVLTALKFSGFTGIVNSILAGAGISAFIIGFALKDIGENFLAGILLAFNRPFKVGDIIETDGVKGSVLALNIRDTQVKTFDGKDIFVPNALLIKNPLRNYTIDGYLRFDFIVGIDYGSDYEHALKLIKEAVINVKGVLTQEKEVQVFVQQLAPSTMDIFVAYWIDINANKKLNISANQIKNNAILAVMHALENAEINTPGNITELKNYRGEALKTNS